MTGSNARSMIGQKRRTLPAIKVNIRRHSWLYNDGQGADLISGIDPANVLDLLVDTKRPHFDVFAAIRIGAKVFDDELLVAIVLALTCCPPMGIGAQVESDFTVGIFDVDMDRLLPIVLCEDSSCCVRAACAVPPPARTIGGEKTKLSLKSGVDCINTRHNHGHAKRSFE